MIGPFGATLLAIGLVALMLLVLAALHLLPGSRR